MYEIDFVLVASAILTTAGKLCQNPIEYALELVKTAKANVSEEYARSLIDLMVIKSRPRLPMVRSLHCFRLDKCEIQRCELWLGKSCL